MSASTTEYKNSFFPRTIKEWNNCSADLIESSSLDVFKNSLAQRSRHPCLYRGFAGTHRCDTPSEVGRLPRQDKTRPSYYQTPVNVSVPSQPFRSRANSLPGANRPMGPWPIRSLDKSLPGPFVPWPFRSMELLFPGTFTSWHFWSGRSK